MHLPPHTLDLTDQVFGRLTAKSYAGSDPKYGAMWDCECICGGTARVPSFNLRRGKKKSCGCLQREMSEPGGVQTHPLYESWRGMKRRCEDVTSHRYRFYGARGITVCERWHAFENFAADMGERPTGHTLDRIDNDGPYSPENCRWADAKTQRENRRPMNVVALEGQVYTLRQAAEKLGVTYEQLRALVGMTPQQVVDLLAQRRR